MKPIDRRTKQLLLSQSYYIKSKMNIWNISNTNLHKRSNVGKIFLKKFQKRG